jgi:hypothetical protein
MLKLSGHHRTTLEQVFAHPVGHNIHWRDARSLLEAVGTVVDEHDGRVRVDVDGHALSLTAPHHHHEHALGEQQVLDLRRLLTDAGITPASVG